MPLLNKTKMVRERIREYNTQVLECMVMYKKAFEDYIGEMGRESLEEGYRNVHGAEGKADDIRREVEVIMYSEALFPEARGDIIGLLEAMDKIPNHAEEAVRMALIQHISIPDDFTAMFMDLVDTTVRCVDAMVEGSRLLFENYVQATVAVGKIDELESEADRIEIDLIAQLFESDSDGFEKILVRDLVDHVSGIADRAEDVGDRIRLIVAKRSV